MSTGSWEVHIRVTGAERDRRIAGARPGGRAQDEADAAGRQLLSDRHDGLPDRRDGRDRRRRRARGATGPGANTALESRTVVAMACASVVLVFALWRGSVWWGEDAATNGRKLYKPLGIAISLDRPDHLELRITDPGWLPLRKLDDLVPDHGHLMHLFLVRWPAMDRVFHLHPEQTAPGFFETSLPSLPGGTYRIYGDIVHDSGFAETAVGEATTA